MSHPLCSVVMTVSAGITQHSAGPRLAPLTCGGQEGVSIQQTIIIEITGVQSPGVQSQIEIKGNIR